MHSLVGPPASGRVDQVGSPSASSQSNASMAAAMPAPVKRPVPALYEGRSARNRSLVLACGAKEWFDPCSNEGRITPDVAVTGSSLPGIGQPIYHEHRREWEQYAFDTRERANHEATRPAIPDGVGHPAADRPLPCMTDIAVQDASAIATTVRLAAEGDEVAFARLVSEHHAAMARVAYVIVGDAETTRDVVQSAWSIAWRRLHTLRDPGHVRAWLVAIAANEARHAVRRERRTTIVDISEALDRHGSTTRLS